MANGVCPYRINAAEPSKKCLTHVQEVLKARFGLEDPLAWIKAQAHAERPDWVNWQILWQRCQPYQLKDFIALLSRFGQSYHPTKESCLDFLANELASRGRLYQGREGLYFVPSSEATILRLSDSLTNHACTVKSLVDFDFLDQLSLVSDTVLRVWDDKRSASRFEARGLICSQFSRLIEQFAEKVKSGYYGLTIMENGCGHKVDKVVVWDTDPAFVAHLHPGFVFSPDSFNDSRLITQWMTSSISELFHGTEQGFFRKTRRLQKTLEVFQRDKAWICLVIVPTVDRVLFVHRTCLLHPPSSEGEKLL